MKSRMAITSMLVLGVFAGGTGTGLAVSGISDSGSAGKAQYPPPIEGPAVDVLGEEEDDSGNGGGGGNGGGNEDDDDVAGTQESDGGTDVAGAQESDGGTDVAGAQESDGGTDVAGAQESDVQATRQVSVQEEGSLPFTGLAAIPLILLGIGLLASGLVLRRRLPEGA